MYSRISNLESENRRLQDKIEENNNGKQIIDDNTDSKQYQNEIVYLNELPLFNCQYYNKDAGWESSSIDEWNIYEDKAADGKNYNNAVHMAVETNNRYTEMYIIDYLLDSNYRIFNGSFMLDEISKSTSSEATLKIYGDDRIIYECNDITGGFVPQNTGDISVENVKRLRFEFSSDFGSLGNYFGVVFYDTFLE